ncbi:MAG: metallophosphoesterase family protein [Bacteroidota bacterium]
MNCRISVILFFGGLFCVALSAQQPKRAYHVPEFAHTWHLPSLHPDHIMLNLTEDPSTSMSVTWRTNVEVLKGYAEIALATAAPKFWRNATTLKAHTQSMNAMSVRGAQTISNYHSVTFTQLLPDTLYAYRVGDGRIWSEWIQFRTAPQEEKPFSFLYVGDAQNYVLELWSRLIREGYRKAPDASFIIHAGDLINNAHYERQWHEWFQAGGFIHSMLPSMPTPGNHEYAPYTAESQRVLSIQWPYQFTLPDNGPEELAETTYFVDYQNTRLVSLNTNVMKEEQVSWLDSVLTANTKKWTIVTFHHPLFSGSSGRNNQELRDLWKPIFDKHKVDLILQGHDHTYARGRAVKPELNLTAGMNKRDYSGTVYVVSVSGGKMYDLMPNGWEDFEEAERDRGAENTQLFQVISIDGDKLSFEAYTATGQLYDAFDLVKSGENTPNQFIERKQEAISARRFSNTIPYQDQLPDGVEAELMHLYDGYQIDGVTYQDEPELRGYKVFMSKEGKFIKLTLDEKGNIIEN